jgi:glycosyltransferase involved in cell wall biosynthesis
LFLLDWRPAPWATREEYFRQLSACLAARGITPVLLVSELTDEEIRRRFESAGAHIEPCSYQAGRLAYARRIRAIRRGFSIRAAHVRFFDYFAGVHWACRLAGVRTIFFTEANSGEWNGSGWRRAMVRLRTAAMCRPLTHVIAISQFIRRRLENVGIPPDRITVIPNGADLSTFHPNPEARAVIRRQMGADAQTTVLVFASVFLEWKRPQVALRVCAELMGQGVNVQLWMAGGGPLLPELEREAGRLRLGDRVKWLGHQSNMQDWMAASDLFLHTAVGEAFGNVFIEAMACGLPAIGTNSGAAPEIVQDGQNGYLVNPGSGEERALAAAAADLIRDPARYARFSAAAQETAARFTTQICVQRTLDFYARWIPELPKP